MLSGQSDLPSNEHTESSLADYDRRASRPKTLDGARKAGGG